VADASAARTVAHAGAYALGREFRAPAAAA
jgi:hypothetical protein